MAKNTKFEIREPEFWQDMREFLNAIEQKYSDKTAIAYRTTPRDQQINKVSYARLNRNVKALGTEAIARGCSGRRCALIGMPTYHWIKTWLALLAIGAVVVPLDKDWSAEDLSEAVTKAECEYLFYGKELKGKVTALKENTTLCESICLNNDGEEDDEKLSDWVLAGEAKIAEGENSYDTVLVDPEKMALLIFTSGTTGKGKGVMLSQRNILSDLSHGLQMLQVTERSIQVLPMHHTFGSTISLLGNLACGVNLYLSSGLRYLIREMQEQKPGHLILVPLFLETFYKKIQMTAKETGQERFLKGGMALSKGLRKIGIDARKQIFAKVRSAFGGELKLLISGGAPLKEDVCQVFEELGMTVLNGYGITECAPLISANLNHMQKKGSVGLPIPGEEVKIIDPNEDGEGEIAVCGSNVMKGYYRDAEATRKAFDEDGYFLTGDFGRMDEDGWLYITGRLKNLIILSNGKNVYPEEIEAELSGIPGVSEVVVYEGESNREESTDVIVAEIFPEEEFLKNQGIEDAKAYFQHYVTEYNHGAVPYKKIGKLKIRKEEFPKNTLRKIMRFRINKNID